MRAAVLSSANRDRSLGSIECHALSACVSSLSYARGGLHTLSFAFCGTSWALTVRCEGLEVAVVAPASARVVPAAPDQATATGSTHRPCTTTCLSSLRNQRSFACPWTVRARTKAGARTAHKI